MLTLLTRQPSPALADCELTFLDAQPIDLAAASAQHRGYRHQLQEAGARLITLEADPELADSVFVEDTALVLDELAISLPLGTPSRRPESEAIRRELARFRPVEVIDSAHRLEGGDILRVGRRLFAGLSTRSDEAGHDALRRLVEPHGYEVLPVPVTGCLHLKTGCTALDERTVLIHPGWVEADAFSGFEQIVVPEDEPFAANTLRVGEHLFLAAGFPKTRALLRSKGFDVREIDIAEFHKAEAGLTCMSLVFETDGP